jgi:hypothetical protein
VEADDDFYCGNSGIDHFQNGLGNDHFSGGDGIELFNNGAWIADHDDDVFDGGRGEDSAFYEPAVRVDLRIGIATGEFIGQGRSRHRGPGRR